MANSCRSLSAALLVFLFVVTTAASEDLSGRWKINYEVQNGIPDDRLAEGSVASLMEKDATLQGRASLGDRGDGYVIGYCMENSFRAAITFRRNPAIFVQLTGEHIGEGLRGSFTVSSGVGFWQGNFAATQMTTGAGDVIDPEAGNNPVSFTPPDVDLLPEPTIFLDPEANWSAQHEGGEKEIFVIRYQRNTILMCRNVPMIWQWWL